MLEEERVALLSIGNAATNMEKIFTAQKEYLRSLEYSCLEKGTSKSTVCSITAGLFQAASSSDNRLGTQHVHLVQILYFIQCRDTAEKFAKVSWWQQAVNDTEGTSTLHRFLGNCGVF